MSRNLRDFLPDYTFLISISGLVIIIDQLTKWLVRETIPFAQFWMPIEWLAPYAQIVHWRNTGAAFGFFQDGGQLFGIFAVIISFAILIYFPVIPRSEKWFRLALCLQMAGALGNFIDRLTVGAVTDFIKVGNFPVFNVADSSISIGVALLLIPYLPQIPQEISLYQISKQARQINTRGRKVNLPNQKPKEDDAISLGILEVVLQDTSPAQEFILTQRARHIRHKHQLHRPPALGRARQTIPEKDSAQSEKTL